jgi:hypothetical protein
MLTSMLVVVRGVGGLSAGHRLGFYGVALELGFREVRLARGGGYAVSHAMCFLMGNYCRPLVIQGFPGFS